MVATIAYLNHYQVKSIPSQNLKIHEIEKPIADNTNNITT